MKTTVFLFSLLFVTKVYALTITSLNVEWFGRGGVIEGSRADEYRTERLREFLLDTIPTSDVLVFQEITDPELLQLTFPLYDCLTYPLRPRHQHVVLCSKPELRASFFVIDEMALGSPGLRPGSGVKVFLPSKEGDIEVDIIGVHLKAGRSETQTRIEQIEKLIASPSLNKNLIIIGDFNTYPKESTEGTEDDEEILNNLFSPLGLEQAFYEGATFVSRSPRRFDHAWVRGLGVELTTVYGPCHSFDQEPNVPFPFSRFSFYNRMVTDHCALQIIVD